MGPDQRWVQVRPPGAQTSITLVTWFPGMPAGSVKGTVLETDDLDKDVTELQARGVRIEGGIQQMPLGPVRHVRRPGRQRPGAAGHGAEATVGG